MKILHFVDEKNTSFARPWMQLISHMERCGVKNHILCRPGGTICDLLKEYPLPFTTYKPFISWIPQFCLRIPLVLKKIAPDLVHTRLSSAAMIAGFWGRKMQIPVVSTVDIYAKGKYYVNSTMLIPCSTGIGLHKREQGFSESAMQVINNAVDLNFYQKVFQQRIDLREVHGIAEDDLVIMGAGRLVHKKGFDSLIKSCSQLSKKNDIKRNWHLWLVGDGPEMSNLKEQVSTCKLDEKTTFWGFQKDVRPYLWASDIYAQPSREEGFSLMLLEAMASGLPSISTAIGGAPEIIEDNVSGWLYNSDDKETLTNILHRVLVSESLEVYSRNAQMQAANYSVERIGDQTIQLYEKIIKAI